MEKFKIEIEYIASNVTYKAKKLSTPHLEIHAEAYKNHIKLLLNPKEPIKIKKLSVLLSRHFHSSDRIFLNGYQSWTESKEHFIDDNPSYLHPLASPIIENTSFSASGDYNFVKYEKRKGCFHGFSYGYIRKEDTVTLYASLNERTGFTIFRFLCPDNLIRIEKDLEGVEIKDSYTILDFVELTGPMHSVFDQWLTLLDIKPPTAK